MLAGSIAHDFNNLLTVINGNAELALMSIPLENPLYQDIKEIKSTGDRAANLTRQLLAFSRRQIIEPRIVNLSDILHEMDKMLRRLISEDIELVTLPADELWSVKVDPGQIEQILTNLAINASDAMPRGGKLTIETANVTLDKKYAHEYDEIKPGRYGCWLSVIPGKEWMKRPKHISLNRFLRPKQRARERDWGCQPATVSSNRITAISGSTMSRGRALR